MNALEWAVELVKELTELADPKNPNRAVMAHLRRGVDRPLAYTIGRVGWLFRRVPDFALDNAVLVAGLFAWVKGACPHAEGVNFGAAFGAGLTLDQKHQREKRFIDLLDTDAAELSNKLRQAVTLIAREPTRIDWVQLIQDLRVRRWSHPDRHVQKDWARGFWSAAVTESDREVEQPVSENP